ncbi:2-polyprenyl-6-methoxyphenol hydroxylase [Geodermatophilus amargosae]|uniref:2-polyprenyl-6-methoxyphenol hydroxylase n=1 Tax=Geodermatophilus amargosae TaxID=1296565 RepID=A0A1I7BQJ0_9ACTN|nr:FAD-dependent monooxygenase [Geodermatophilus amargosae]SFT89445.1 2-polyprenyl-6-methoxyphenol hydroxylase [Geodermatophilus amargosae]
MDTSSTDVLVVGAGPTGLTLACELRRRGIDCRVVERATEPHYRSRGKGLQPRSLEVLDDLGIAGAALERGRRDNHLRLYVGGRLTADVRVPARPPAPGVPYPDLLIIPQWCTEQVLRGRLESLGGGVEFGRELTSVEQDGEGVTATVRAPAEEGAAERVRARYVVACDGGHSAVRDLVGLRMVGTARTQHFVLGDVRIDGLEPGVSHAWFDGDTYLAADPLSGTGVWQVQANVEVAPDGSVEPASLELFQRLFAERGLGSVHLHDPTWLSDFSPRVALVDRYRVGRVLLAGDAAHVHSPAGGQGMNTGIQDAYNLGWKLALVLEGKASDHLLDTYEEERRPVARSVLRGSDVGHGVVFSGHPVVRVLRERVLAPLLQVGAVQRMILDRAAELGVGYRNGPLAQDLRAPFRLSRASGADRHRVVDLLGRLRFGRGPHGGDRAPDARGRDAGGEPVRVFDHLRGPHWSLLLFPGAHTEPEEPVRLAGIARHVEDLTGGEVRSCLVLPSGAPPAGIPGDRVLHDVDGEAHRLYGAQAGALYLVRPDGYVGHRAQPAESRGVLEFLGSVYRGSATRVPTTDERVPAPG